MGGRIMVKKKKKDPFTYKGTEHRSGKERRSWEERRRDQRRKEERRKG